MWCRTSSAIAAALVKPPLLMFSTTRTLSRRDPALRARAGFARAPPARSASTMRRGWRVERRASGAEPSGGPGRPPQPPAGAVAASEPAAPVSAADALLRSGTGAHVVAFTPSHEIEDDLAAAAGVAARCPSLSLPWGVNEAYTPLNWPSECARRLPPDDDDGDGGVDDVAPAAVADFYARHLLRKPPAAPPSGGEAAAAEAEAAAGVTDACDVALVVPWCFAGHVFELFPAARLRRFDAAADCWSSSVLVREQPPGRWRGAREVNVCATRYSALVDATADAQLWALPRGTVLLPRSRADREQALPVVDVLLHGGRGAAELVAGLSRRLWRGRTGPLGDWLAAGTRADTASEHEHELPPLLLLAAPVSAEGFAAGVELRAVRLPVHSRSADGGDALAEERGDRAAWRPGEQAAALALACGALAALEGTGLVPPGADVAPLTRALAGQADADLTRAAAAGDAAAAHAVLPLAPAAVLDALRSGDVASGTVALVDARGGCDPGRLRARVARCDGGGDADFEALHAATGSAAAVVFFCNHASSTSPKRAQQYAQWLRRAAQTQTQPSVTPPPRLRVLAGGMGALVAAAAARGEDMEAMFASYDGTYIRNRR